MRKPMKNAGMGGGQSYLAVEKHKNSSFDCYTHLAPIWTS